MSTSPVDGHQDPTADFASIYRHGFARTAACTISTTLGEPDRNAAAVLSMATVCAAEGVAIAVFPELTLSGYSVEDIVLQDPLLDAVEEALAAVIDGSKELMPVLIVGAPLWFRHRVYNTAAVVHRGRLVGVQPGRYQPTDALLSFLDRL